MICIDVPEIKGKYNPKNLYNTINKILKIAKDKIIIIRSTIDPLVIATLKKKLKNKKYATILFSPEFLREGYALQDLIKNPNYYAIVHKGSKAKIPHKLQSKLYDCNLLATLKISFNAWRATKVSFANMLLQICNKHKIDYEIFYELFVADELNVSSSYMKGGTPFGGYCLPKETRILSHYEKSIGSGLLNQVMRINERMVSFWTNKIIQKKPKRIIFDSLSFKARVNDKRNSALLSIYNKLESLGFNVKVIGYNFQLNDIKRKDLLVTNNNLNEYQNICEIIKIA
jgi:nucleotide sugar dehydrogenase